MTKRVYEIADEFHCSEDDLLEFFKSLGLDYIFRLSAIDESYYNKAKEHFLRVPTPEPEPKPQTTVKIDYLPILAKYDLNALATSPIKYYKAVSSVADTFLDVLQDYETQNSEAIGEFSQAALTLGAKYTQNPNLTDEENNLLEERQKFLSRKLEAGTDDVKEQILSLKEQAKLFFDRLDEINHGKNSIRELAALEAEPRANFAFLVENTATIVQSAQDKLNFFILHKDLVSQIVSAWETCSDDYKTFKTNRHEELITLCRADEVESEMFDAWYDDWQTKRLAMERRLLPLIEFALKGNLLPQDDKPSAFEEVLKTLCDYRDAVDKFYLHDRKNIYQKFAFTAGGDLQEKFETESELYKRTEIFQREIQKIIFARDKTEERIFLLRWAEPLLNLSVDAITDFIRERELDSISEKILNQFAALRRQNLMSYLADSAAFSKALQQREKDYNQLMFRMRKGLRK